MAEQTFKSPGFFEREIDLTTSGENITGIPAGIIGTAEKGPAFVPVTVGSFSSFEKLFGTLSSERFGPYAVSSFLQHQEAVTYVRVLGAGANQTTADVTTTINQGTVKNAGFKLTGTEDTNGMFKGAVQFLVASHETETNEASAFPIFKFNNSVNTADKPKLVRGMFLLATGSRIEITGSSDPYPAYSADGHSMLAEPFSATDKKFKIIISSSSPFTNKEYEVSLDPKDNKYISKVLNTNLNEFHSQQHVLYAHFPVDSYVASVEKTAGVRSIAILSGSDSTNRSLFGNFSTRYQTAKSPVFISQPYGPSEHDLFHFECLSDGAGVNNKYKISISDLRKSTDPNDPYGTFTVLIRDIADSDKTPTILESYINCNLNPSSRDYIGKKIGDKKTFFNFDSPHKDDRRLTSTGRYPVQSSYVRVILKDGVENKTIPADCLPFGFRGIPLIKTSLTLTDNETNILLGGTAGTRLSKPIPTTSTTSSFLYSSILPPVPYVFKATKNAAPKASPTFIGESDSSSIESVDDTRFWGVRFQNFSSANLVQSETGEYNELIENYSKFLGIQKLGTLTQGKESDSLNDNKFTLAKVILGETASTNNLNDEINNLSSTADTYLKDSAYIRDASLNLPLYSYEDALGDAGYKKRLTFGSIAASNKSNIFNKFSKYMKFSTFMFGGFDGVNILDRDQRLLNDRASSSDPGGKARGGIDGHINLPSVSSPGIREENNIVNSYKIASEILTDPFVSNVKIITIPGIRDKEITKQVIKNTEDYSKAIYILDIPFYDSNNNRIFADSSKRPNIQATTDQFISSKIDSSYAAAYFPDVTKYDPINRIFVKMPSSIAALGAYSYNDSKKFPWFAPAGFNRGALSDVSSVDIKLNTEDRNKLYEARINPIASFPNNGYVIFGQKTTQKKKTALDRVNVRRMLIEVKRQVAEVSQGFIFEKNTPKIRSKFVSKLVPILSKIQIQEGIDQFKVIMDASNNPFSVVQANKLVGKIILVPTRAVEFIAIDFILTNAGISFE